MVRSPSFTAIGSQQKPVSRSDINRLRLHNVEALGLFAGQRPVDPRSRAHYNAVVVRAHDFRRFVLRDALDRAVKFQDLARSEVPVITLLRHCPTKRNVALESDALTEFTSLLPVITYCFRDSIDLIVSRTDDQGGSAPAAPRMRPRRPALDSRS